MELVGIDAPVSVGGEVLGDRHVDIGVILGVDERSILGGQGTVDQESDSEPENDCSREQRPVFLETASQALLRGSLGFAGSRRLPSILITIQQRLSHAKKREDCAIGSSDRIHPSLKMPGIRKN